MSVGRANRICGWTVMITVAGSGCATTQISTDHDPRADFADYRSFAVKSGQVLRNGRIDQRDTLMRDRIDGALANEFLAKGLEADPQNPDLIVTYTAGAQNFAVPDTGPGGWGYDGYGFGDYYDDGLYEVQEGSLLIDVMDAHTKKLVWRSVAVADDENFRSPQIIASTVNEALKKYPAPLP